MLENEKFELIKGNNIEVMNSLPTGSVDCIFADPPYNMQTEGVLQRYEGTDFKGVDDEWDKFDTMNDYKKFTYDWLKASKRVLKKDGSLWVIGSFHNIHFLGTVLLELGYWIQGEIVWNKPNPVPNFSGTRFTNAHETLLWCTPHKNSKKTFNYKTMKHLNGGKQMKSVWDIPLCTGNERLKDDEGNKLHNTQKPIELLKRIVLSTTRVNDVVLDPFSGTATTGEAALMYQRKYIGIDIDEDDKYLKYSKIRLENVELSSEIDLIFNTYDKKPPQVKIEKLIEKNYVSDFLTDKDGKDYVLLNNGKVLVDGEELSIHKGAAKVLGKVNHNGWTFWYYKGVLIDELREKYRKIELNYE